VDQKRRTATALAIGLTLAACSKPRQPQVYTVTLANLGFGPTPAELHVGDVIQWSNADIFQHSATAKNGAFDVELPPKGAARTVLTKAGTIDFYCRYHPNMTGRLTVVG
jgi:plastocyanin